jgi:hypothetical protein
LIKWLTTSQINIYSKYCTPKASLWVCHTLKWQSYIIKVLCVLMEKKVLHIQHDLQYDDSGSHCMLKIESSNCLMWCNNLSDDGAPSKNFRQYTMVLFCLFLLYFVNFVIFYWSRAECVFPYTLPFFNFCNLRYCFSICWWNGIMCDIKHKNWDG